MEEEITLKPVKWLKKKLPDKTMLKRYRALRIFGEVLHRPILWRFKKSTLAKGVAIGLFVAFIPLPTQMIFAAALAVLFSANLPVAVSLVWVTNPLTMPPIYYFCYKVGAFFLSTKLPVSGSNAKMASYLYAIWKPFLLGSFICGISTAILGYILVYVFGILFSKSKKIVKQSHR